MSPGALLAAGAGPGVAAMASSMHISPYRFDCDHYNSRARIAARWRRAVFKSDLNYTPKSLANHLRPWYRCAVNSTYKW